MPALLFKGKGDFLNPMNFMGLEHLSALAVIALLAVGLILTQRHGQDWPRGLLAFGNLAVYAANQAAYATLDYELSLDNFIPLHLCDIVAVICGFALLTRKKLLCELAYFWGLTGTFQGLVTPALSFGWDHPVYWSFFLQHGIIVIAALFIPLAMGWRPDRGTFWRVLGWGQVYFFGAMAVNFWLGTNFGFLREKPYVPSVLDHFGDWPWYLIGIEMFAAVAFLLLLLPFWRTLKK